MDRVIRVTVTLVLISIFTTACNKAEVTTPVNSENKTNAPATEAKRAQEAGIPISPAASANPTGSPAAP